MHKIGMLLIGVMLISIVYLEGCTQKNTETPDSDGDGYNDSIDAFPFNSSEWNDIDHDGHGDNIDAFPLNSSEWNDSDNDGYGDNSDAFPYDSTEHVDSDKDGYGDNNDDFPFNALYHKKVKLWSQSELHVDRLTGPFYKEALIAIPITMNIKYVGWTFQEVSTGDIKFYLSVFNIDSEEYKKTSEPDIFKGNNNYFEGKIAVTSENVGRWSWNWRNYDQGFSITFEVYYVL